MRLQGKNAIVTGGAHGIGRAIAERFAQEGASVLIADVDEPAAQVAAKEISTPGHICRSIRCEVSSLPDVKAAVAAALETAPRVDVLCNNAAYIASQWH